MVRGSLRGLVEGSQRRSGVLVCWMWTVLRMRGRWGVSRLPGAALGGLKGVDWGGDAWAVEAVEGAWASDRQPAWGARTARRGCAGGAGERVAGHPDRVQSARLVPAWWASGGRAVPAGWGAGGWQEHLGVAVGAACGGRGAWAGAVRVLRALGGVPARTADRDGECAGRGGGADQRRGPAESLGGQAPRPGRGTPSGASGTCWPSWARPSRCCGGWPGTRNGCSW